MYKKNNISIIMQVIHVYLQSNRKYNFELYQTDYTVKSIHRVQTHH